MTGAGAPGAGAPGSDAPGSGRRPDPDLPGPGETGPGAPGRSATDRGPPGFGTTRTDAAWPAASGPGAPGTAAREAFIRAHTVPAHAPLVPEIVLHLATEITPIWQASEAWLHRTGIEPPFWAFAWPGGQALARHILDHPGLVRGRRVLDFAAGCGVAAIACAMAGAAEVEAAEIDPLAAAAIALNAAENGRDMRVLTGDVVGQPSRWDLILCGDVCYEAPMTRHILPWLRRMAAACEVWVADPGRAYLPADGLAPLAEYDVPTPLELEDRTMRPTRLFRMAPGA